MKAKCVEIIEFNGCKHWLDEECPYRNKETGDCENPTLLKVAEEIGNCVADSNSG